MILATLFFSFFKIGLFSFGGGYAMIPLIQKEIVRHGWMEPSAFADIIAIAEMTPGPIAVNSATFVGYRTAGILGGVVATIGVTLPSALLILLIADAILKHKSHPLKESIFSVLRPIVAALIVSAAFIVAGTSFLRIPETASQLDSLLNEPLGLLDLRGAAIFVLTLCALAFHKLHPILAILISGILGYFLYGRAV